MTKTICDRCGCDMTTAAPSYPYYYIKKISNPMLSNTIDLCPECQMLLKNFLQEKKDKIYDANKA